MSHYPLLTAKSCIAVAVLALGASMAQAQDLQTVKIAHTGPTSGSIAHIGKDTENGVSLAIDKLNSQNLVIGGKKIKFELVADDATLVLRVDTKKRADSV
jgi:branched-chain amino acid transport system substrate-binding protein